MIPAGYLYKSVVLPPAGLMVPAHVCEILSVSGCLSPPFADYTTAWRHNGYWLFDHPNEMLGIARDAGSDLTQSALFYYELHSDEFNEDSQTWTQIEPTGPVNVALPDGTQLKGFDVVCHSQRNRPECSPLSCNGVSTSVAVNQSCLFATCDEAVQALKQGYFNKSEPGPFRIYAVYTTTSPRAGGSRSYGHR